MTAEQLQSARAQNWRQAGNPLFTADEAGAWLRETGLCLFLPRPAQLAAPAPSFVEAALGESNALPAPPAIQSAEELLRRLLSQGDAVPLSLLGSGPHSASQPDFLATPETLPFIYALRGDKEWKRGPRGKSSPLVVEVWKLLSKEGPLTASEVKDQLGRELTEAAALRALAELWNTLRVEPVLEDTDARWQPLERAHAEQMQAGSTMAAAMAISALVSLYLQSAIAATEEEIEAFLSPVCSRSKVHDALRGLLATRQLASVHMGGQELYHLEGALPEFPEVEIVSAPRAREIEVIATENPDDEAVAALRAPDAPPAAEAGAPAAPPRKKPGGLVRRSFAFRGEGKSDEGRKPFTGARKSPGAGGAPPARKPYGMRGGSGSDSTPRGAGFDAARPWDEEKRPRPANAGSDERRSSPAGGERKPFGKPRGEREAAGGANDRRPGGGSRRDGGERRPFPARNAGDRKPFPPRDAGERKPFPRPGAENRSARSSQADHPDRAERAGRPFRTDRTGQRDNAGAPPSSRPARSGDRGPARRDESGGRPFPPRPNRAAGPGGDRKPFPPRRAGEDAPRGRRESPRSGSEAPRGPSEAPGSRSDVYRGGARGDAPRDRTGRDSRSSEGRPFRPAPGGGEGDRKPFGGPRKPFRSEGGGASYDRPKRSPGERSASSPSSDRPRADRPSSFRGDRPPARPRPGSFSRGDAPERPPRGARGAEGDRAGAPSRGPGAPKKRTSPFTSSGKPRQGFNPTGRPGPRANRPAGTPGRPVSRPKKGLGDGPRRKPEGE